MKSFHTSIFLIGTVSVYYCCYDGKDTFMILYVFLHL